ncbi:MAG: HAD-IA family hydrolase, partial [Pseudomonadota bacterium]
MIRHIVFDIGHVLIQWDPEIPYRRLIPDAVERRWFLETVCTPAWNREQDRGRSWAEAESLLIRDYPDKADLIRAYRAHWSEMVPGEVPGTFAILRALLDAGHDVTMLTNFHQDTFREAQAMYPALTETRGVTVSGEVRMLKPDRDIYDRHVETFGLDPAACLFFDDTVANV